MIRPACALAFLAMFSGCESAGSMADASCMGSGMRWTGGNSGSPMMNPGQDCIGCHNATHEGPRFAVAGTVYADATNADGCNGLAAAYVELTGADGSTVTATTNSVGNFSIEPNRMVKLPYKARVIVGSKVRKMNAAQTDGACNSCHTLDGIGGAPGRVLMP